MLTDVLKQELSKSEYKEMTPAQIVTVLNARQQRFSKLTLPEDKSFSVEPTFLLNKAGIGPETINKIMRHKKTKGYLKSFLSKPVKYEEFDYWLGVIDWLVTTKTAWYRRKKLLSADQRTGLCNAFSEATLQHGGNKVVTLGAPLIKDLVGKDFITLEQLKEVIECVKEGKNL